MIYICPHLTFQHTKKWCKLGVMIGRSAINPTFFVPSQYNIASIVYNIVSSCLRLNGKSDMVQHGTPPAEESGACTVAGAEF